MTTDTVTETEIEETPEPVEARSWRPSLLLSALILLSLAAAIVTAGTQWHEADKLAQEKSTRKVISTKAGEFGQALLSYDYRNLKNARDRVLGLAAGDFAKTYDVAFTGGLEGVITKLKATATATVRSIYLENVDEGRAKAIVVLDSEVKSTAGTRRVVGSYLDMELIRQKGQWRVNSVASIGAVNESMSDPTKKPN